MTPPRVIDERQSPPIPIPATPNNQHPAKRTPKDFRFGKVIGEGSFSTVYLAKDIHTSREYAIKVCDKRHIIREKKTEYVKREKEVLNILSSNVKVTAPFFVKLYCTFQDMDRLYFVLSYAKNSELLPYINKVGSFDITCTRFYSAELLLALEHLHSLGIIHRGGPSAGKAEQFCGHGPVCVPGVAHRQVCIQELRFMGSGLYHLPDGVWVTPLQI